MMYQLSNGVERPEMMKREIFLLIRQKLLVTPMRAFSLEDRKPDRAELENEGHT